MYLVQVQDGIAFIMPRNPRGQERPAESDVSGCESRNVNGAWERGIPELGNEWSWLLLQDTFTSLCCSS